MDCMQLGGRLFLVGGAVRVSIPQAVWIACNHIRSNLLQKKSSCFNTASGMDCMQSSPYSPPCARRAVSIPQAVWIACNSMSLARVNITARFQDRKRYGLHAILPRWDQSFATRVAFQYRKRYGLHAIGRRGSFARE